MGRHCCFGICNSDGRPGRPGYDPSVKFFKFPQPCQVYRWDVDEWTPIAENRHISGCKDCRLCRDWMKLCKRKDERFQSLRNISRGTVICSKHFEENLDTLDYAVHRPMSYSPANAQKRRRKPRKVLSDDIDMVVQETPRPSSTPCSSTDVFVSSEGRQEMEFDPPFSSHCDIFEENLPSSSDMGTNTHKALMIDVATHVDFLSTSVSSTTQTTYNFVENSVLRSRISLLEAKITEMKRDIVNLKKAHHSINDFSEKVLSNPKMCRFYTGFDKAQYLALLGFAKADDWTYWGTSSTGTASKSKKCKNISAVAQLMIFFLRARRGLVLQDIAYRFGLHHRSVSRIFTTWVQQMFDRFSLVRSKMFATRDKIKQHLPYRFKNLKNIRVIIDCAEFLCQKPSNFEQQENTYSNCKAHSTFKVLLGCSPIGAVMFVSDLFEGSTSDREIVEKSGLVDLLEEGDLVLAGRGFTIRDLTDKKGEVLQISAFLKGRDCLTPQEEINTKQIAANRIFVEHVVGKLKQFQLLNRVIPLTLRHVISQLVFVCACLLNFHPPPIQQ